MRCRGVLVVLALAVGPLGGLALAAAPGARLAGRALAVDPVHVRLGGRIVLSGRGFAAGARVTLLAGRTGRKASRIGSARAGRSGGFVAPIRIQPHAAPGLYVLTACVERCRVRATARFRVLRR